jgi:hypothetical protein
MDTKRGGKPVLIAELGVRSHQAQRSGPVNIVLYTHMRLSVRSRSVKFARFRFDSSTIRFPDKFKRVRLDKESRFSIRTISAEEHNIKSAQHQNRKKVVARTIGRQVEASKVLNLRDEVIDKALGYRLYWHLASPQGRVSVFSRKLGLKPVRSSCGDSPTTRFKTCKTDCDLRRCGLRCYK